jgi:flagellar basal-body rod protein FlgC
MFSTFEISASGMDAERIRLQVIANNVANANVTRTDGGGPFRRQMVILTSKSAQPQFNIPYGPEAAQFIDNLGVKVLEIVNDPSEFNKIHNPDHPDADANGYVSFPNVNSVLEMVDMISATRSYEANVTAMNAAKSMIKSALGIGGA